MRESLSYGMFPLLRENMDTPNFNPSSTSLISSNGYYGFQPQINPPQKISIGTATEEHATNDRMDIESQREESDMHMQILQVGNIPRQTNRKRHWEYVVDDDRGFKKRRDDAGNNHISLSTPSQITISTPQVLHMRKPTHNIPDIPRCTMGHYC